MKPFQSDAIDGFFNKLNDGKVPETGVESTEKRGFGDRDSHNRGLNFGASRVFAAGARFGDIEVIGPVEGGKMGAAGRMLSQRAFHVRCNACGKSYQVSYRRLYNGGNIRTNCGCKPWYKHPALVLEEQRFGCVEVLSWSHELGEWEVLCHECGEVFYRRSSSEIRREGGDCENHITRHSPPRGR